jgi:hypothetical protein
MRPPSVSISSGTPTLLRALNDKCRFVIHAIILAKLPQAFILPDCICQNRIANCSGGVILVFANNLFDLKSIRFVASILNSVCTHEEDVSGIHEFDIRNLR